MRLNPLVLLLALLHGYIGVRLFAGFDAWVQAAGFAVLAACFWAMPKGWYVREDRGPWAVLLPWLTMGFFSWLLVLTVARDLSLAVTSMVASPAWHAQWSWL